MLDCANINGCALYKVTICENNKIKGEALIIMYNILYICIYGKQNHIKFKCINSIERCILKAWIKT